MSVPGTYQGGIRSLECLRIRCRVCEESGCWLLRDGRGRKPADGTSLRVWVSGYGCMSALRAAWEFSTGRAVPAKMVVYHNGKCDSRQCINPKHLACGTKVQEGALLRKRGILRGDPTRAATNARNARTSKQAKMTPELAQWARESRQSQKDAGHGLGVASNVVWQVRNGLAWTETAPGASVFTWRPSFGRLASLPRFDDAQAVHDVVSRCAGRPVRQGMGSRAPARQGLGAAD